MNEPGRRPQRAPPGSGGGVEGGGGVGGGASPRREEPPALPAIGLRRSPESGYCGRICSALSARSGRPAWACSCFEDCGSRGSAPPQAPAPRPEPRAPAAASALRPAPARRPPLLGPASAPSSRFARGRSARPSSPAETGPSPPPPAWSSPEPVSSGGRAGGVGRLESGGVGSARPRGGPGLAAPPAPPALGARSHARSALGLLSPLRAEFGVAARNPVQPGMISAACQRVCSLLHALLLRREAGSVNPF